MAAGAAGHAYPVRLPGADPTGLTGPTGSPPSSPSPPVPTQRVPVAFAGLESGVAALTWGQWSIWDAMLRHGCWLPLGGVKELAPETGLAEIAEELCFLMTRFATMRTRLQYSADGGEPQQELFGDGVIELQVFDAQDGADAAELAARVESGYRAAPFDFAADWPVRMAVVRRLGRLTHLVAIMCHLATDGAGSRAMLREVAERPDGPAGGQQPLAQAVWQASPPGRRQHENSLRYQEKLLAGWTPGRSVAPPDPRTPRYWTGRLDSPALGRSAAALARRTGVAASPIMMALFAIALAKQTGIDRSLLRPLVGNRFRPGLADVVCMLSLPGMCVVDVADATVDEVIARAQKATISAYKYGYYDPREVRALLQRTVELRGPDVVGGAALFNNQREEQVGPADADDGVDERESVFTWAYRTDHTSELTLVVEDGVRGATVLEFAADTHRYPPALIEAVLRDMESLGLAAAADPATLTGVPGQE